MIALTDAALGGLVAIVLGIVAAIAQVVGSYITANQVAASEADTLKAELDGQLWDRIKHEIDEQNDRIAELERRLAEQSESHEAEVVRLTDERNIAEQARQEALRRLSAAQAEIEDLKSRVNTLEERQGERRHRDLGHDPDRRQD